MDYLLLGIGLLILVKGADVLVESASSIAKIIKVPGFIIGLFVIAIGTSAPEAAIGVISGIQGTNLITLGDVVGSNIVNITIVIGITALILPLEVESSVPRREILISILVQVCLVIMLFTSYILSRFEAAVLLAGMFLFLGYVFKKSKKGSEKGEPVTKFENEVSNYVHAQGDAGFEEITKKDGKSEVQGSKYKHNATKAKAESMVKLIILFLIGLMCLIAGATLAVNSAVQIAHLLGLSETFIGLTVIAFGTSLPELVTSLVAVYKKEGDIAVGTIIGSNIFNVLLVLGISGLLHPIAITADVFFDLFAMLGASLLLFIPTFFFNRVSRKTGFVYLVAYAIYISIKLNSLG